MAVNLKKFYFTFGCGFPLAERTQVVAAPAESVARAGMFKYYSDRWCACYPAEDVREAGGSRPVEIPKGSGYFYRPLEKVITAYDEESIGCE